MGGEAFELPERLVDPEDDDDDAALSLSDFPLATMTTHPRNDPDRPRRSSSQPPEFFEFFTDLGSHMRSADDLIVSGKLVPLRDQWTPLAHRGAAACRRCESLSELERSSVSRPSSWKAQLSRSSRSLDYRKLRRPSSHLAREAEGTSSSRRSLARSDSFAKKPSRPRWRVLPFGAARMPAEMELRDMRSRQLRRTPSTMFTPPAPAEGAGSSGGKLPVDGGGWKGSWKLVKALSCKDPASVAVATSLACLPHV